MKLRTLLRALTALTVLLGLLAGCAGNASVTDSTAAASSDETAPTVTGQLNVYCFQAGKADAFLLWNDAGAVLIDTGESGYGKTILEKLSELGIQKLDYLIITHFDKDHVGGAKKILTDLPVDKVLQSNVPKEGTSAYDKYVKALTEKNLEPTTVRETLRFRLGDAVFTVDPPAQTRYPEEASNNSSLIVTAVHGANRLVFTGDAEDLRLKEYLRQDPAPCTFLKLPYHGYYQACLPELLKTLRPAWAVITSSAEEPEDEAVLELLDSMGVRVFLTRTAPVLAVSDGSTLTLRYADD